MNSSRSQKHLNYTMLCSMNDHTDVQRTTTSIHIGRVEKLLFSNIFLLLSATEELEKKKVSF
jgi:hypothetical protein